MYKGFDEEKQAAHERELVDRHGPQMQDRVDRARAGRADWRAEDHAAMQAEQEAIEAGMARALAMGDRPHAPPPGVGRPQLEQRGSRRGLRRSGRHVRGG